MEIQAKDLALGWLTVGGTDPFGWLSAASAGGFGYTGVKIAPRPGETMPALLGDAGLRREFGAECRQAGIKLLNMGSLWLDGRVAPSDYAQALDIGAELGADYVIGISIDPELARRKADMLALAYMARERGMQLTIEFFAYSEIRNLREAIALTAGLDGGDIGVVFDALHFHRSGGVCADLSANDVRHIDYFQLCDAPLSLPAGMTLSEEGRAARLFPGEGDIPLRDIMALLPDRMVIEVEIPHRAMQTLTAEERGKEAMRHTLSFLNAAVQ